MEAMLIWTIRMRTGISTRHTKGGQGVTTSTMRSITPHWLRGVAAARDLSMCVKARTPIGFHSFPSQRSRGPPGVID